MAPPGRPSTGLPVRSATALFLLVLLANPASATVSAPVTPPPAAPAPGSGACEDTQFGGMQVQGDDRLGGGACLVQADASWLADAGRDVVVHRDTPTLAACCELCGPAELNATAAADLTDPICVYAYCDPAAAAPCNDGQGGSVPPGTCLVGMRALPFNARRPPLWWAGSGLPTTVTGTVLSPTVAALALSRPPAGFTFAGPRSFFLSSFNGRCRYDSDAAFNASLRDPTCMANGTLSETLAACAAQPGCGALTYYPVSGGPFAGGIGRFTATLSPEFQALPGVGFLKNGPALAACASMSPYSVLYTRDGGPADGSGGGRGGARSAAAERGRRVGAALGIAAVAALLAGLGAWGGLRWRGSRAAAAAAAAAAAKSSGGTPPPPAAAPVWPARTRSSAFAALARSMSEGARSSWRRSGSRGKGGGGGGDCGGGGGADLEEGGKAGGSGAPPLSPATTLARRRAAFVAGDQAASLDRLMADLVARSVGGGGGRRGRAAGGLARAGPTPHLPASRAASAPGEGALPPPATTPPSARANCAVASSSVLAPDESWELDPAQVSIARRPDGADWLLGAGAAAHVYRGLLNSVQDVAIKVWIADDDDGRDEAGEEEQARRREARREDFRRETATLRSLRDRNIVAFVGACLRDGCSVLLTEYCPRGDLYRALAADGRAGASASAAAGAGPSEDSGEGAPTPTAALAGSTSVRSGAAATAAAAVPGGRRFTWTPSYTAAARGGARRRAGTGLNWSVAADVSRGLAYLHDRRIVHLDVKSANVLLDATWTAKLGDVGLSRALRPESTRVRTLEGALGTLAWAAPEVLLGGKAVGVPADIWSLGAVLWEVSTGETPPDNRCLRPVAVPGEAPAGVAAIIDACLAPDPAARPTAAALVDFFELGLASLDAAAGVKGAGREGRPATTALATVVGRRAGSGEGSAVAGRRAGSGEGSAVAGGGGDDGAAGLAAARAARLARESGAAA